MGDGIASIALADGRAFTTTTYGENEFAVALDEETGQRCGPRVSGPLSRRKRAHALAQSADADRGWKPPLRIHEYRLAGLS